MTKPVLGWIDQAACAGQADVFVGARRPSPDVMAQAAATCAGCPVLAECAAYAEEIDAVHGVWAGRWFGDRADYRSASVRAMI